MIRGDIIQVFLSLFEKPCYLEIGVDNGRTFNNVVAHHKRAVDPAFKYATTDLEIGDHTVRHFPITSDAYFAGDGAYWPIDVAFIDGLHTFEQTLRDLLNVQANLKPNGVIIIDDINPPTYHASLSNETHAFQVRDHQAKYVPEIGHDSSWMGDVYKLVFFIQSFMPGWSYACVSETGGQLVVWRQTRSYDDMKVRSYGSIGRLSFIDVVNDQAAFKFSPLDKIVERVLAKESSV